MKNGIGVQDQPVNIAAETVICSDRSLHPVWRTFIRYCAELKHGEIERLKIQDGLPVLAETVKKKIKFTS